uniref:Syntaxin-binding protein 5 n=1 Tax=Ascaris suum TaxID=6253 RepID=F1KQ87_ASCSU
MVRFVYLVMLDVGVDYSLKHPSDAAVLHVQLLINEGALVTACGDDMVHLWNFRQKVPEIVHSIQLNKEQVTCINLPFQSKWLHVGTERGNVYFVSVATFTLSTYVINWNKAIDLSCRTHPGAVKSILTCPIDASKILILFDKGIVVLWNLSTKEVERFSSECPARSLAWHDDGRQFICGNADGSLVIWNAKKPGECVHKLMPHGQKCRPITQLPRCMQLIEHIKSAPDEESFFARLVEVHEWQPQFGKSEMARWADVLNMCDEVLKRAVTHVDTRGVLMAVDAEPIVVRRVAAVLSFTALLFENTFTRSIYNSVDRLMDLLDSGSMEVVVETLRLLQVISKRSRFISQHLSESQQKQLTMKLTAIVQCWSGKLRNSKMDECCTSEVWSPSLLPICYQAENSTKLVRNVQLDKSLAVEMDELLSGERIDEEERISLFARMRLVRAFSSVEGRRLCVIARLLALSILVYSRTLLEEWQLSSMIYDSLVEEISHLLLVDMAPSGVLVDTIKTEALRTLTSIISLDRPAKQNVVVECLGANSYHGFMARAVRICVEDLRRGTLGTLGHTSVQFCTALFSLLYHLAGFDNGGEALVSCALTESLLSTF